MTQYIPKDAVVAEIERIDKSIGCDRFLSEYEKGCNQGKEEVCDTLLSFINTLEIKEVDLEKEIELVKGDYEQVDVAWNNDFDFIARHFYELGLKTQKGE
jgi:hypothetical protein